MNTKKIPLIFTKSAAKKVKFLIKRKKNKNLNLRVYIVGGGCSGFQYRFSLDEKINKNDFIIEEIGVKLIVDALSLQYLYGGKIDYLENLEGSKFIIINPNAKITCSCGTSFSI